MANQNILTISDSDNEDINYCKSSVKSEYHYELTLAGLLQIFQADNEEIFHCDTKGTVTLIKDDNTEISLHQYQAGDKIAFIKISDERLFINDCEILLSVKNMSSAEINVCKWLWCQEDANRPLGNDYINGYMNIIPLPKRCIPNALAENTDGYANCIGWNNDCNKGYASAIDACTEDKETYHDITYQGYLPSIYQLKVIYDYCLIINYIMKHIGFLDNIMEKIMAEPYYNNSDMRFWSSSIMMHDNDFLTKMEGYVYAYDLMNNKMYLVHRNCHNYTLPVFKKIQKENI